MMIMLSRDIVAGLLCFRLCQSLTALIAHKTRSLDAVLARKLYHISIGLVVMLCWPFFSSGYSGATSAGLIPVAFILPGFFPDRNTNERRRRMLRDRFQDHWAILNAAAGYAVSICLVTIIYWRSTVAIATISNLCAGDGVADIVGRRLGSLKLPYNRKKSFAGSIAMVVAGFFTSIWFAYYFAWLGYIVITEINTHMLTGFLVVSIASTLVESYPLSTKFDDNWTVPLAAFLVANFVL